MHKIKFKSASIILVISMVDIINNTSKLLGDDLKNAIKEKRRLRIAASCFFICAYKGFCFSLQQNQQIEGRNCSFAKTSK